MTQPTLSRQLIQLEEELGVRLFDRSSHNIVLTEDGMLLRRRAEEIIGLAEKTKRGLTHEEECIAGEISIGCAETKNMSYLSQKIVQFREQYPGVIFDIYTANADDVKERIENGILDMGLMIEPVEISKYHFKKMPYRERWCILMRKDCPLAKKERIEPKDLTQVPLLITSRKSVKNELESWFGKKNSATQQPSANLLNIFSLHCEAVCGFCGIWQGFFQAAWFRGHGLNRLLWLFHNTSTCNQAYQEFPEALPSVPAEFHAAYKIIQGAVQSFHRPVGQMYSRISFKDIPAFFKQLMIFNQP